MRSLARSIATETTRLAVGPRPSTGPLYEFSAQEEALSVRMTAYWTNFAKTGDPNGVRLAPWPRYTSTTERIVVLDEPAAEMAGYRVEQCAFLDRLPALFGGATSYTPSRSPVRR
jgi:carboxylesterase type B